MVFQTSFLAKNAEELKNSLNIKDKNTLIEIIDRFFKSFEVQDTLSFLEELLSKKNENNIFKKKRISNREIREYFKNFISKVIIRVLHLNSSGR